MFSPHGFWSSAVTMEFVLELTFWLDDIEDLGYLGREVINGHPSTVLFEIIFNDV